MTTPRIRSLVSIAATLTFALALGGCASASPHPALNASALTDAPPPAIRFDNEARDYVHVYLIGDRREWLLGRVVPGGRANLTIPVEALDEDAGPMRLAVLVGERVTFRAAAVARAASALPQPAAVILSRRWTFSPDASSELIALPLGGARVGVGRP